DGARGQVDLDLVAFLGHIDDRPALHNGKADVDRVAEEDPGEGRRDHAADPAGPDGDGGVLPGGAGPEVLVGDDDVAGPHPPRHGPHTPAATEAPASAKTWIRPSCRACWYRSWVAGMTIRRMRGCALRPSSRAAAVRRSSIRAFVQEPMNTWSTSWPSTSDTGTALDGSDGWATMGSRAATSISRVRAKRASGSETAASKGRSRPWTCWRCLT